MCRFLGYIGPPVDLNSLLFLPEYSLNRQSYNPRFQRFGTINADGFGVGWYDLSIRDQPARYRTTKPMWSDSSFQNIAGLISSGIVLGIVRSATPPLPVDESYTQPFTNSKWLFAHNGAVEDFIGEKGKIFRDYVQKTSSWRQEGGSDSEVLFSLCLSYLLNGTSLSQSLIQTLSIASEICGGRFNMVISDGKNLSATAWGDSLYLLEEAGPSKQGRVLASEPYDNNPSWRQIQDRTLVELNHQSVEIASINLESLG